MSAVLAPLSLLPRPQGRLYAVRGIKAGAEYRALVPAASSFDAITAALSEGVNFVSAKPFDAPDGVVIHSAECRPAPLPALWTEAERVAADVVGAAGPVRGRYGMVYLDEKSRQKMERDYDFALVAQMQGEGV